MKILDSNNEEEIDTFLKSKVKHIYASEYAIENQKQIKKQFEIITSELTDRIISAKDLSEFNLLMKEGITKGYLTHKISTDSTKGYIDLKTKILDEKIDVPLRYEKLKALLSGKDENGKDLWNNGNAIRTHRKEYQIFIQKTKPEFWEEISKMSLEHKYREKTNRQGHSNSKKSYWAKGYDTLQDFYELSKESEVKEYKRLHNNCCGLGDPKTSIKNLKKIDKKQKRKEFRKNKKSSKAEEKKTSEKEKATLRKKERKNMDDMEDIDDNYDDEENEIMEKEDSVKEKVEEEKLIIGKKKKRTGKRSYRKRKGHKK